jgi:hypothetical protein
VTYQGLKSNKRPHALIDADTGAALFQKRKQGLKSVSLTNEGKSFIHREKRGLHVSKKLMFSGMAI